MKIKNIRMLEIHIAVFLFGVSGLFGKLLLLQPMIIVLGRAFFSCLFLLMIILYFKKDLKVKHYRDGLWFILMGVILAIHWSTFFKSIQVSSVAIGLLTFSTFPIFATFIAPYFSKEKMKVSDIVTALITFLGVILVIPGFELGNNLTQGVLWGVASGFTYAILSILNRKFVNHYSSTVIAFYEQIIAAIILIPVIAWQRPILQTRDILLLIILGIVFTGIAHSLFINGLKNVKTQTAGIISSLEPVYGIIFAALLIKEIPSSKEILGGIIILSGVLYSTFKSK